MEEDTMDSGQITTCRVVEFTYMQMVFVMMVNTKMTKRRVTGATFGRMVENTRAGGTKASNMVWDFTLIMLSHCSNTVFGKMESG
jgi:hypothetical protein